MDSHKLEYLLTRYFENRLSSSEEIELFSLLDKTSEQEIAKVLPDDRIWLDISHSLSSEKSQEILHAIIGESEVVESIPANVSFLKNWRPVLFVAASILAFVVVVFFFKEYNYRPTKPSPDHYYANRASSITLPGTYLQTGNNNPSRIDTLPDGVIMDGLYKKEDVLYVKSSMPRALNVSLFTSRASTQKIVLEDGSLVWMNASTSVKLLQNSFKSRDLALAGEAFFEVVHNDESPFRVSVSGKTVEDIGTSFNIKAYGGSSLKTTLLEGSIKIDKTILKPGEQFSDGHVYSVDTSSVVAWKKNLFHFQHAELNDLLEEIAVWYGLKLNIPKDTKTQYFDGEIQRGLPLGEVLSILSAMGIDCSVKNDTITVH